MYKFSDENIREAAYYIWKNNGCPTGTSSQDWNSAVNQLNAMTALKIASRNLASSKLIAAKRSLAQAVSLKSASFKTSALKSASLKSGVKSPLSFNQNSK